MKFSNWIVLILLITSAVLFWSLRSIIIVIFAGIILAMALCTLVGKLKKLLGIPRSFAYIVAITSVLLILIISVIIVVPQFTKELQELIIDLPNAARTLIEISSNSINRFSEIIYGEEGKYILKENFIQNSFNSLPDGVSLANGITDSFKRLLNIAGNLGLGIVQLIFVLSIGIMIFIYSMLSPKEAYNLFESLPITLAAIAPPIVICSPPGTE